MRRHLRKEIFSLSFAPSTSSNSFSVDVSCAKGFRARTLAARITGHAVFAFVGWPYENTDPHGGLTGALRTRKSGIITLDVDV